MTQNSHDFLDYLGGLETETVPSGKKEIAAACAAVLKKAGLKRKASGTRKAGRVLLVAAAVMVYAAVTAAAAGLDVGEMFRGYFESSDPSIGKSAASLTSSQVDTLNKSGTAINQSATSNGTTVTLKSAVADKNGAYLMLDVTTPEGTKLSRNDYAFEQEEITPEKLGPHSTFTWSFARPQKDDAPGDNRKTFVISVNSSDDLRGQTMKLALADLSTLDKDGRYGPAVLKGNWNFSFVLGGGAETKQLAVNKEIHYLGQEKRGMPLGASIQCLVKSASLSPLSAVLTFSDLKGSDDDFQIPEKLTLRYKDGSAQSFTSESGVDGKLSASRTYLFDAPIDPDNVSSITIADLTVPVS